MIGVFGYPKPRSLGRVPVRVCGGYELPRLIPSPLETLGFTVFQLEEQIRTSIKIHRRGIKKIHEHKK
jgi:hypothetical protein